MRGRAERSRISSHARSARGRVAPPPGVGEREDRRLRPRRREPLHVAIGDRLAVGPDRELLDLGRELVHVVADELEQRAARLRIRLRVLQAELLRHPLGERALRHVVGQDVPHLRDRLAERGVRLHLGRDEREHRLGRRRRRYSVTAFRSAAFQPPVSRPSAFGVPSTSSTTTSRPPPKSPRALQARPPPPRSSRAPKELDRLVVEARAEAAERPRDLRPVAAGDEVGARELGHRGRC